MLTLLTVAAALLQTPPAPPEPPRTHVFVRTGDEAALDRDGDGQVTREEFTAPMGDAFGRLDKDGDGRLSTEELKSGHGGEGGPGASVRRFELSSDGPGERDIRVFTHGAGSGEPIIIHRRDGGPAAGEGGRVEVHTVNAARGPADMDKDGDGKISEAEFTAPLREAFARMDADRSGFVERGERSEEDRIRVFTHRVERTEGRGED